MKNPTLEAPVAGADAFLSDTTTESLLHPVGETAEIPEIEETNIPAAPSAFETLLLHTVSHELRTPFSVIQSSAELLVMMQQRKPSADPAVAEHARIILKEISHVTDLVNRMVLCSRWEPEEPQSVQEPSDIEAATRDCVETSFHPWKDGRSALVKVTGRPRPVRLDPVIYQLVLKNLLENACKYSTGSRPPVVHLRYSQASWSVSVRDYGIGIPEADLAHLFKPFTRGSNVGSTPGMGLGLRIAHYLVNNFCGNLAVVSAEKKGTTATASFLYR